MMNGWDSGMGGGWWFLMIVAWIVVIALVVWAIARLFPSRSGGDAGGREKERETPREILDLRLARGEIDTEEYARLRDALEPAQGARR